MRLSRLCPAIALLLLSVPAFAQDRPAEINPAERPPDLDLLEPDRPLPEVDILTIEDPGGVASTLAGTSLVEIQNEDALVRFRLNTDGGFVLPGVLNSGVIPATEAGTRLMWYPRKAAFRAGRVTGAQWDDASIGHYSTAMGYNTRASGIYSTAMGGGTTASGQSSTAMGVSTTASGSYSTAMGWSTTASGSYSTAMGWSTTASGGNSTAMGSTTTASGTWSTALGYNSTASGSDAVAIGEHVTASGSASTAMGRYASTDGRQGSFVYGDRSTITVMNASADNQFSVRAAGGYRLFSNAGLTAGVTLAAGAGSWTSVSDRNRKEDFLPLEGEEVLLRLREVPVSSWRYIAEEDTNVRHIGPMAQDWDAAFPELGGDGLTINSGDFDGVNLAAIQALEVRTRRMQDLEAALLEVTSENAELRAQMAILQAEQTAGAARIAAIESALATGRSTFVATTD
jgi:hypothetical protein